MRTIFLLALAALTFSCKGPDNSINAYFGYRSLTSDLDTFDDHEAFGVDGVLVLKTRFLAIEGGFFRSEEDQSTGTTTELDLNEYFIGLRFIPWKVLVEPYISAGASFVDGSFDGTGGPTDDTNVAGYIRVGAAYPITGLFRIGVDGRALLGSEFDTGSIDESADYFQIMLFVGVGL